MSDKFKEMSAEVLGQVALAKGIECDPLADSREDIIKKLEAVKKPSKPTE